MLHLENFKKSNWCASWCFRVSPALKEELQCCAVSRVLLARPGAGGGDYQTHRCFSQNWPYHYLLFKKENLGQIRIQTGC